MVVSVEVRRPVRILERRRFQDVLGGASGWSAGAAQEELLEPQTDWPLGSGQTEGPGRFPHSFFVQVILSL